MPDLSDPKDKAKFDLFMTIHHGGGWFTCRLFRLMGNADPSNLQKLQSVFPIEGEVWNEWVSSGNSREYFKDFPVPTLDGPLPRIDLTKE